jgi:spermidine synthase
VNLIPPGTWPVYTAIALSGLTALGAEVVWTRLLSLNLGGTTYTFSLILAGFLLGLGIGSSVGSSIGRSVANPRMALGICQMLIIAGLAWASYQLNFGLPNWPINLEIIVEPRYIFQMDIVRCLWVVLPAAMCWGASFPLALAAVSKDTEDPGRLVGTVYAANTVGAILGAVFASLVAIRAFGTDGAQKIFVVLAAASALLMFFGPGGVRLPSLAPDSGVSRALLGAATLGLVLFAVMSIQKVPPILVGYGRYAVTWRGSTGDWIYVGEGMNSSMAVSQTGAGMLNYHNAGKIQASSLPQDMSLQRMLGHLTTLLSPAPDNVLVIGCGAGVTAGAVSIDPAVKSETIAEIEPLVPQVVSRHFGNFNFNVVDNPKVHVQIDDARHFLLTSKQKWSAITSDPFDPWVKGAATLYTEEFWKEARSRLTPDGVVTVFVQLYESGMDAVKSEMATFFKAFPNGIVFGNTYGGSGYDVVMVGFNDESRTIDVDAIEARLNSPEYAAVKQSLAEINVFSAVDLFAKFAAQGPMLSPWLADAQVNKDRNLRLQYLAGADLNKNQKAEIYSEILSHRQYPEKLFVGHPSTLEALRQKMLSQ